MKKLKYLVIVALGLSTLSCEKMLDYPPEGAILAEDALKTPDDAQRLLNSCYDVMGNIFDGSYQNLNELLSDNLATPNGLDYQAVYNRQTNFFTSTVGGVYANFYYAIYRCNSLLANFDLIQGLSDSDRSRMEAEARFIRAVCHFYTVKTWAQPYGYTADNSHLGIVLREAPSNEPLPRSTVKDTYDFILSDLSYAQSNLPDYNDVYANKNSATAFLAMVNFQMSNYADAVAYANDVINSGTYTLNDTIDRFPSDVENGVALNNPETIFGIVSFINDVRTEGFTGNYNASGPVNPSLSLSSDFNLLMSQNAADTRKNWVILNGSQYRGNRFNGKNIFNIPIAYLTEIKLIRAEALGYLGQNLSTAIQDINDIRDRAFGVGVNPLSESSTASQIIDAARVEYRKETVCEGKWTDQLKRRGANGENIVIRGASWDCNGMILQFPNNEFTSAVFEGNPEGGCN